MNDLVDLALGWLRERRALVSAVATLGAIACFAAAWQTCAGG